MPSFVSVSAELTLFVFVFIRWLQGNAIVDGQVKCVCVCVCVCGHKERRDVIQLVH